MTKTSKVFKYEVKGRYNGYYVTPGLNKWKGDNPGKMEAINMTFDDLRLKGWYIRSKRE